MDNSSAALKVKKPMAKGLVRRLRHDNFAMGLANGLNLTDAYMQAGFATCSVKSAAVSASRLAKTAAMQELVKRYKDDRAKAALAVNTVAIQHTAITKERVAVELGRIAFANMQDYMQVGKDGLPRLDWSKLTREQASALVEVTVDEYVDGGKEDTREVKKVKFKLGDKRAALMDLSKLFDWIPDRRGKKVIDEFDNMTDEELEAWIRENARIQPRMRRGHRRDRRYGREGGIGADDAAEVG